MTGPHLGWFIAIVVAVALILSLQPREQELRIEATPASATSQPAFQLFVPCPLGPRNFPVRNERTA